VTFDGSTSFDPDGQIKNCTWDFGDGTIERNKPWAVNKIKTHAYEAVGSYTVTLTVTDSDPNNPRTNMTSHIVTVQEAWPMYRHDWSHTGCSTFFAPITDRMLWDPVTIGPDASADSLMYSSPAVVDGVVYVGSTNGTVFAINATTGKDIWHKTPGGPIHSSPAVADGLVFIGSDDQNVYALNASTGAIKWSCPTFGWIYSSPAVWNGSVYVTSQEGKIYSINATTSIIKSWWPLPVSTYVYTSPAVADRMVFFGSNDKNVYARDALNVRGTKWNYSTGGAVRSSPVVAGGMVFVGSDDNYLYALNATETALPHDKRLKWKFQTNGDVASSPCVAGGMVFVASDDGYLYAVNIATGKQVWNQTIGIAGWSSPVVADCTVFIGSKNGKIYAFHKDDGDLVWSYQTAGPIDSSAAVFNNTLYIASKKDETSNKATLYAFSGDQRHDVAITEVTASPYRVVQNRTITISVTVENQGTYDEININVIAYYFNATYPATVANSTIINSLPRHGKVTIPILWNTTGVPEGTYTISANATLAIDDDLTDNYFEDGNVTIGKVCNINVTDVWVGYNQTGPVHYPKTVVGQGYNATVCVTVKNEGEMEETNIAVTAYWSNGTHANQTIGSYIINRLPSNMSITITIRWNTGVTGVPFGVPLAIGNYTISAYASPVPGETDTSDNYRTDGEVYVSIPGDVNGDGKVDLKDVYAVGKAYNSIRGEYDGLYWHSPIRDCCPHSPNCDINDDGKIDLKDYYITQKNYGKPKP
jgi:outer membrane protein assembly factor BamB